MSTLEKELHEAVINDHLANLSALAEAYHFQALHQDIEGDEQASVLLTIRALRERLQEEKRELSVS